MGLVHERLLNATYWKEVVGDAPEEGVIPSSSRVIVAFHPFGVAAVYNSINKFPLSFKTLAYR